MPRPSNNSPRSTTAAYAVISSARCLGLVVTVNNGFDEWGGVLGDEVMAAALIDRLLHHCHIVNIRGNNYRMRAHQDLLRARRPGPDEDTHRSGAT